MTSGSQQDDFIPPRAADGFITYYAHIKPENLLPWAQSAMEKSYVPHSNRPAGVMLRTERGEMSDGCSIETINYDGLSAVEVALGRLFSAQPWADHKEQLQRISDAVFMTPDLDPTDPSTYVPDARSLEWLHKFGSRQTVLRFATPAEGIRATHRLADLLPHAQKLADMKVYYNDVSGFHGQLASRQPRAQGLDHRDNHNLLRSRLFAVAPYSTYRVGVVIEAYDMRLIEHDLAILRQNIPCDSMDDKMKQALLRDMDMHVHRFNGLNVELSGNDGLHAEACAIGNMVMALGPQARLKKLSVQGGMTGMAEDHVCTPCGKCRQFIAEFAAPDMKVVSVSETQMEAEASPVQLLPHGFSLK